MKPTAEMVERAEVLVERLRDADMDGYDLSMERATDALAQALADEHERTMERAALVPADKEGEVTTHVSPCCAAPCEVEGSRTEFGSRYHVCSKCGQPCDPVKGEE